MIPVSSWMPCEGPTQSGSVTVDDGNFGRLVSRQLICYPVLVAAEVLRNIALQERTRSEHVFLMFSLTFIYSYIII